MNNLTRDKVSRGSLSISTSKFKLIPLKEFYSLCQKVRSKITTSNRLVLVCLLARYGVEGIELCYMRNLRFGDIDRNEKVINIVRLEGDLVKLPIDDNFIQWLDSNMYGWDIATNKSTSVVGLNVAGLPRSKGAIYASIKRFSELAEIPSICITHLVCMRQLELLLEMRKTRLLGSNDFGDMVRKFKYKDASYMARYVLMDRYEALTGDEVIRGKCTDWRCVDNYKKRLEDPNAHETASKLIRELKLEIDWRT